MHDHDPLNPVTIDIQPTRRARNFDAVAIATHASIFWVLLSAALCSPARTPPPRDVCGATATALVATHGAVRA